MHSLRVCSIGVDSGLFSVHKAPCCAQVAQFSSDLNMFVNRKERLLALLNRFRLVRHHMTKRSRRGLPVPMS